MTKWYELPAADEGVIISSRIRLARNLANHPFPSLLNANQALAKEIDDELTNVFLSASPVGNDFSRLKINNKNLDSLCLVERHCISPEFFGKKHERSVLVNPSDSVSIMINEEDHLRLQVISSGDSLDEAYVLADKLDDFFDAHAAYAFDKNYGYLTACPTNTGTGMRASYMLHLPALELTGRIRPLFSTLSKLGITARGIYGEGSEPLGSIYQVSNQTTIGKSECEIISGLKGIALKIIEQENEARQALLNDKPCALEDRVYRSYGVLAYARRLTSKEAMSYLSDVRLGLMSKCLDIAKPKHTVYSIMINIQAGCLQHNSGRLLDENERDCIRADYVRKALI